MALETSFASPMVKSFIAGSLSGTCSTIIFQPLDLVKTRIQTASMAMAHVGGGRSQGMFNVFIHVVKDEKVAGLWKGVTPSLTRTVPGIGIYFSSLHWLKSVSGNEDPNPLESIFIGASARSISGAAMLPFTVVKTRFESGRYDYRNISQAIIKIYKVEGAKGLYSGLGATLLRDAPFSGIYLAFYTQFKKYVKETTVLHNYANLPALYFMCGIFAGCAASIVTQPADVIKTYMQLYPNDYKTIKSVIVHIQTKHGPTGFLRGIAPRTIRRTLMAALAWSVYESVMEKFGLK